MEKRKNLHSLLLLLLATALISTLVFTGLYLFDNKYTQAATQPVSGILTLSADELEKAPVRYLIREWECYPGALLRPEDFQEKTPDAYRQYAFIGQYGGMEMGNAARSPHGSATYRLTLELPAEPRDYALELPAIFSAYRLYLDDTLVLQQGNPDSEAYTPALRTRTLTFRGQGRMQLLLAVTDQSWIYSGMIYPPAFGDPLAVNTAATIRLALREAAFLVALFALLLSLYLSFRARWRQGLLFAPLCLCFMLYLSPPLLQALVQTGIQPWYSLSLFGFYAMLALVVSLQNTLCGIGRKTASWTVGIGGGGAILALACGCLASRLDLPALQVFSATTALLKYGAALYLLAVSGHALWHQKPYSSLLFSVSLFFAFSLLFDRLLPAYEPIYGGWFMEIGGLVLVIGLACVLWSDLTAAYRFRLVFAQQHRQMEQQLAMQKEHYRQLSCQVETAREATHNLRHHMRVLRSFADVDDLADIQKYLREYEPHVQEADIHTFTAHPAADAVLHYYAAAARDAAVRFDASLRLPPELEFPDDEFCILLGNLLENAVEACARQKDGDRFLYVRGTTANGQLQLVVDNSFDGNIRKRDGCFYSSKRADIGLGIRSVQAIVERHGGLASFEPENTVFRVSILIPLSGE